MKKNKLYYLLSTLVLVISTNLFAQNSSISIVSPDTIYGSRGTTFSIDIVVGDPVEVTNLLGVAFNLEWSDSVYIEGVNTVTGSFFGTNTLLLAQNFSNRIEVGVSSTTGGHNGSGVIITCTLKVKKDVITDNQTISLNLTNLTTLDGDGNSVILDPQNNPLTIVLAHLNNKPELDPITGQSINEGETLNVPINSSDPDEDNITLSSPNLPIFGNLADNGDGTGMISFIPQAGDAGDYPDIMVIATDNGNPSPKSDTVMFTLTVGIESIPAPGDLTATSSVENEVELNWTDNSDNEDGFYIEREISGVGVYSIVDSVTSNVTTYTDVTVLDGVKYNYKVKGYNSFTESGYTNSTQVVTMLPAPSNLTSQVFESPSWCVKLTWEDNSDNESGFCIMRDSANTGFVNYDRVNSDIIMYTDLLVASMESYIYKVYAFTPYTISDNSDTSGVIITDVEVDEDLTPKDYMLYQNYPNPFNPTTRIKYVLNEQSKVKLIIYNAIGEMVNILVDKIQIKGFYETIFNASNLPSGIYLYRLTANENTLQKKMILLK